MTALAGIWRFDGRPDAAESCARITALSISAAADAALASLPWHDRRIARRPNQPALLDVLDGVLDEMRNSE